MAFVFIQHLAPSHVSMLATILSKETSMPVTDVISGIRIEPDHVYVIPPNTCMTIAAGALRLVPRSDERCEVNHPIDIFLRSLAKEEGSQSIGIILSGTASDGSAGVMAIKEEGGITFAQDKKTAKFEQMPQNAIATGCVDFVLSPEKIAGRLADIRRGPHLNPSDSQIQKLVSGAEGPFKEIIFLLKKASGVDFACYKPETIKRRLTRRMALNRKDTLQDYLEILKKNPLELEALHQDVLIKVTQFFRDPEIFQALQHEVYPHILKNKSNETPLRIWVPACSTGEEVYSLAIALLEHLGSDSHHLPIQFFGSDIKDSCIETARNAVYPESITQDVSPERLKRFFNKVDRGYQITKLIRDRCIFAKQNVAADPPFSRIDFISCRNLLIYLAPALQQTVINTFHYSLNPDGFLLLGPSESMTSFPELFKCVNKKARIYSKKQAHTYRLFANVSSAYVPEKFPLQKKMNHGEESRVVLNAQREADRVIVAKFEQAGVVINEAMEVLQFRGDTSSYLKHAPGTPSRSLLKMAREGLLAEIRGSLQKVIKKGGAYKQDNIRVKYNGNFKNVSIEVIPLKVPAASQKHFLISFTESRASEPLPAKKTAKKPAGKSAGHKYELEKEIKSITDELASTKAYMQSIIEERESANEELQIVNEEVVTSNEELQSLNEEMQSSNEELQTAKEEIQASNEEIITVNEELNSRNAQLTQLNDDFLNLINSIQMPIVIVGHDLRIRRFTPAAEMVFSLVSTDVGRLITDIKLKVNILNLESLILQVIKDLSIKEQEVQDENGAWYSVTMRPYKTLENKIDGVVIKFSNIDTLKKNQRLIEDHQHYLEAIIQAMSVPLLVLDENLHVKMTNESFTRLFHILPDQVIGGLIYQLMNKQWDMQELHKLLEETVPEKRRALSFEVEADFPGLGPRVFLFNSRSICTTKDLLLSIEDITENKQKERSLHELNQELEKKGSKLTKSNLELEQFAAVASHDLQEPFHIISSFMGLLASGYKDKLEPKAQELIKIAGDAAGRAQELIRSLLDYARIDTGERQSESVDLKTVLTQVLLDLREKIEESSMEISCDPLPKIMGDPLHLARLFQNLISNAIKYRSERPLKVYIAVTKTGEEWIFQIKDNGMGFDPKNKELVFEMFRRLHGREVSGIGIGLSTCKKIVERHGGKIWAESEPGKGTSFYFSLPDQPENLKRRHGDRQN